LDHIRPWKRRSDPQPFGSIGGDADLQEVVVYQSPHLPCGREAGIVKLQHLIHPLLVQDAHALVGQIGVGLLPHNHHLLVPPGKPEYHEKDENDYYGYHNCGKFQSMGSTT
jgi:hypothetical protein